MKKKNRKSTAKVVTKGTLSLTALLALGICVGTPFRADDCIAQSARPAIQHELVPHVVLPETIQYNKIAKSQRTLPGLSSAGDYGMVSPFVATYTPFPSYQLPLETPMRTVGQSVYPVTPMPKPLPLPNSKKGESDEGLSEPQDLASRGSKSSLEKDKADSSQREPILLASAQDEVVYAAPLAPLSHQVTQTGIFCQKPAKPPAAWSFSSPVFKAASVPMGVSGNNGYISQYGPRGCQTQVGFNPMMGQQMGADGMMQPVQSPMQSPMHTLQMGQGVGMGGPQIQMLPNGMLMVTMPPNHAQCGLLRCRCGNQPRTIFLPAGPGMMPNMMPQPNAMPTPAPTAMMMPGMAWGMTPNMMQAQMVQPQLMPSPLMNPTAMQQMMMPTQMLGMGMMRQPQENAAGEASPEGAQEPKAPLPINSMPSPMFSGMGMMSANPYALYAQQAGQDAQAAAGAVEGSANPANAADPAQAMSPMMFFSPPMMQQMPSMAGMQGGMLSGMYMTPYGMMVVAPMNAPMNGWGGQSNGMEMYGAGFGMMAPSMMQSGMPGGMMGGMPMMYAGFGQQPMMPGMMNGGGMSTADVIQLMMMLNNTPQRRVGLFQRLAERREARRERRAGNDPLNMLMQAWSTPYTPYGTVARMPSRNAYPYGFFGAQVGAQETANYGGVYDLYMGHSAYPGLY